jgi:uncharacterized membrane protein (UPF0136 family)
MSLISALFIVYGIILIGGGAIGYAKAGSKASLISGIVTGLLALLVALVKISPKMDLLLGAILAFAVAMVFMMRYSKTKKAMPAIPMIVISEAIAIFSLITLLKK